ncbi:MAG: hypothetical protein QNJ40_23835 [Xanthomonadales bacterium]|nr:hypothetical protein [Xanthomonadales bacterium]
MMRKALQKTLLGIVLAVMVTVANAMTLSQAVEKVRRETGGKVLSAQTKVQKDREVHLIKVLTQDGRVRTVRVPGNPVKPRKRPRG